MAIQTHEQLESQHLNRNIDGDTGIRVFRVHDPARGLVSAATALAHVNATYPTAQLGQSFPGTSIPAIDQRCEFVAKTAQDVVVSYSTAGMGSINIANSFEYGINMRSETCYWPVAQDPGTGEWVADTNGTPIGKDGKGVEKRVPEGEVTLTRLLINPTLATWSEFGDMMRTTNALEIQTPNQPTFALNTLLLVGMTTRQLSETVFVITFLFLQDWNAVHPHHAHWVTWTKNPAYGQPGEPEFLPVDHWARIYGESVFTSIWNL